MTTIGVLPRATPSTVTRPPAGSLRISMAASATVDGAGGANSKEWAVMVPPASDSGTCRVAPSSVTSSAWLPSLSSRRSGVLPRGVPSTATSAPAGEDSTDSVAGVGAPAAVLRIDST